MIQITKPKYRSAFLNMDMGDHHDDCPICKFTRGQQDPETLLAVIATLDAALYERERGFEVATHALVHISGDMKTLAAAVTRVLAFIDEHADGMDLEETAAVREMVRMMLGGPK